MFLIVLLQALHPLPCFARHNPSSVRVGWLKSTSWMGRESMSQNPPQSVKDRPPLSCAPVFVTSNPAYMCTVNAEFGGSCACAVGGHLWMTSWFLCMMGGYVNPTFYASALPQIVILIILRQFFDSFITDPHFDPITGHVPLPPARRAPAENVKTNRTSQDYDQLPPPSGKAENCSCRKLQLYEENSLHP